ncbi:MAG: hypothetical protein HY646_10455 [Acidobacteria bacterium]|nr:hypothetical protein [Acidobacteriota bacterium]
MKRRALPFLFVAVPFIHCSILPAVRAETETIDLKALAKKARPAVMLLVISDATGNEIATGTGFLVSSDGKPKRSGDAAVSFLPQLITNDHVIENAASAAKPMHMGAGRRLLTERHS